LDILQKSIKDVGKLYTFLVLLSYNLEKIREVIYKRHLPLKEIMFFNDPIYCNEDSNKIELWKNHPSSIAFFKKLEDSQGFISSMFENTKVDTIINSDFDLIIPIIDVDFTQKYTLEGKDEIKEKVKRLVNLCPWFVNNNHLPYNFHDIKLELLTNNTYSIYPKYGFITFKSFMFTNDEKKISTYTHFENLRPKLLTSIFTLLDFEKPFDLSSLPLDKSYFTANSFTPFEVKLTDEINVIYISHQKGLELDALTHDQQRAILEYTTQKETVNILNFGLVDYITPYNVYSNYWYQPIPTDEEIKSNDKRIVYRSLSEYKLKNKY
jgi:hypothetical protein